ncbi:extracellular tyrosine-protein kinase PKDCC-like [Cloeon dipterum]|uniref:extracellular tyrosine-protein kinase PKDCC-like n=1 Tax=Cloeon dipterum TaxID=197152 RepID=UPI00321FA74E
MSPIELHKRGGKPVFLPKVQDGSTESRSTTAVDSRRREELSVGRTRGRTDGSWLSPMPDGHAFAARGTVMAKQEGGSLSGLYVFVASYVVLFAIAGVLLFGPSIFPRSELLVDGLLGHEALGLDAEMDCNSLRNVTDVKFVNNGWTKTVYSGFYLGTPIAIKTVNPKGISLQECLDRGEKDKNVCYQRSASKIINETLLLRQLVHENIIKVLGSCIMPAQSGSNSYVALVTELGEPLDAVRLLQLPWEDRLRLALGMARILYLLAHSPLGSLAMNDFRHQQFVIVNGELKLSDVDDVGLEEPFCVKNEDCVKMLPLQLRNASWAASASCSPHLRCVGHNERVNVLRAGKQVIQQFLPLGAPAGLRPQILNLLKGYRDASWNSARILLETEALVDAFASGKYLETNEVFRADSLPGFVIHDEKDLPGQFDYPCPGSTNSVNCVHSVYSYQEAAEICSADPRCKAFVIGFGKTWTDRSLAIFKSGVGPASTKRGFQLFVRQQSPR